MTLASNVQLVEFPRVPIVSTGGQGRQIPTKIIIVKFYLSLSRIFFNTSKVLPFIVKDFFQHLQYFYFSARLKKFTVVNVKLVIAESFPALTLAL